MNIIPFNYGAKEIRVLKDASGEPLWVAKDICEVLGINNSRQALAKLDDDEKGVSEIMTPSGVQKMNVINESGLYTLILRSNKKEAKAFKKWVTKEVLPSIRKSGSYSLNGTTNSEFIIKNIELLTKNLDSMNRSLELMAKSMQSIAKTQELIAKSLNIHSNSGLSYEDDSALEYGVHIKPLKAPNHMPPSMARYMRTIKWTKAEELELLRLRELGYSHAEIGAVIGKSAQSVRIKLYRLLKGV